MNHERVTELALANGFKLKEQPDGSMALNPYVFEFAAALLAEPRDTEVLALMAKHKAQADRITELEKLVVNIPNRHGGPIREMLRSLQAGEITVSRAEELLGFWRAGTFHDGLLPAASPSSLGEDETPFDRIAALETAVNAAWQPLTPELLEDISQREAGKFWLAGPELGGPVVGVYQWQEGRNPDGFNILEGGRIAAEWVTHVMPFLAPALPGAQP